MGTNLYWINGPWAGKPALAARPRGGEWLQEEVTHWREAGIKAIVSLLEPSEEQELNLYDEGSEVRRQGLQFFSLPIPDRGVPVSEAALRATLERVGTELAAGKNVLIHCRQGVGRSGLVASCLLVNKGFSPDAAVDLVRSVRGTAIPETDEQRRWIDHYAALASTR